MANENQIKLHLDYIRNNLIPEIASTFPVKKYTYDLEHMKQLDGYMSSLYTCNIKPEDGTNHSIIIKFMKGDKSFRDSTKAGTLFANEIFIYSTVLPYYREVIAKAGVLSISVEDWVPNTYVAKFGHIKELSDASNTDESILALEFLQPKNYRMGPHLYLNRDHLYVMTKPLAEYHSLSYVLRVLQDKKLSEFTTKIIHLPFNSTDDNNFFDVLFNVAFERFFRFYDRLGESLLVKDNIEDGKFAMNINRLREKYGKRPTDLLERFHRIHDKDDETFAVILHGDYNRNNVLFKYNKGEDGSDGSQFGVPIDLKMIDFQELRYGTPAIDLSFYMYMNMDPSIRDEFWMDLLKYYHGTMFKALTDIVMATTDDAAIHESLNHYSFDKFYRNFSKSAFYGAMICMHFLPWKVGTDDECAMLGHLFETDMHGDAFHRISMDAGGEEADRRIFDVLRHANRMGYMSDF